MLNKDRKGDKVSKTVAIVGGGITGLSAAYYLKKASKEEGLDINVKLIESSNRLGGKIKTEKRDGFIIERGPDSFLSRKHPAVKLIESLGLEEKLVRNGTGQAYILVEDKLHKIPPGSFMGIPTQPGPFLFSGLFSPLGKLRAGLDLVKKKSKAKEDQSLGAFFRYRFGDQLVENLIEPLLSGIYSGDIDKMSLMSTFPNFYEIEQEHGSLIKGLKKTMPKSPSKKERKNRPGIFFALEDGFESLVDHLKATFSEQEVLLNSAVDHIEKKESIYHILLADGKVIKADGVIMASPHNTLPKVFSQYDFFDHFKEMPQTSVANVALAYDSDKVKDNLDGTGYVVSRNSDFRITACTWTHKKWPHTAPKGKVLLRSYVGKPDDQAIVDASDEEIVETVLKDLRKTMTLKGDPLFTVVTRFKEVMPQYTVGHQSRVKMTRKNMEASLPGVFLAGSSYDGVGVPDCIEQGETAVQSMLNYLK